MPAMNTDPRRKAAATYAAKRKAEGWAKVTVWLSPEAQKQLVTLTTVHGSRDAALNAMLTPAAAAPKATGQRVKGFDPKTGEPIYEA